MVISDKKRRLLIFAASLDKDVKMEVTSLQNYTNLYRGDVKEPTNPGLTNLRDLLMLVHTKY